MDGGDAGHALCCRKTPLRPAALRGTFGTRPHVNIVRAVRYAAAKMAGADADAPAAEEAN